MSENANDMTKAYELRNLTSEDMFPMFQILSKVGIREFKNCFESEDVKKAVSQMASGKAEDADLNSVGISVALDIAGIVMSNIGKCKEDIYQLLAQLSGKTKKDIAGLPMITFTEMIIDVVKKEEFKDFFQAVAKLFR